MRRLASALSFGGALALGVGACGDVTIAPPASTHTASGPACPAHHVDCVGNGACETLLGTVENCGGCGDICASTHATASCKAARCDLVCDAGFGDCDGRADDGCEADFSDDPANCGACGRSCGAWGDCFRGACVEVLGTVQAALVGADSLVLQGDTLSWATPGIKPEVEVGPGQIASVSTSGGIVTAVATGLDYPQRLHANGTWFVWSDVTSHDTSGPTSVAGIYRMAVPTGPVESVFQSPTGDTPKVLDVDASTVYFTTGTDVLAVPIVGGGTEQIAAGFVEVSAGHLDGGGGLLIADLGPEVDVQSGDLSYATHPEGTIHRIGLATHADTLLLQHLDTPIALTTTADALYWAEAGSMTTYEDGDAAINLGTLGSIGRAGLDGSNPTTLADQQTQAVDLAVDTTHVYWADAGTVGGVHPQDTAYVCDGALLRVPIAGGPVETVVPAIDARNLVLSTDAVFFSSWMYGLVVKIAKP